MLDMKHIIYSNSKCSKMNLVINSLLECYDFTYDFHSNWDESL